MKKAKRYLVPKRRYEIDPFSHILIARKTFPKVFEKIREKYNCNDNDAEKLRKFYYGGALFPDIGNYPGGYTLVSDFSHNLRTWELAKTMLDLSQNPEETAFSYGWISHIIADIIGHPEFTNLAHAEIVDMIDSHPEGIEAYDHPLEHKKTEFGAAAHLLGLNENTYLWDVKLFFPLEKNKSSIISRAFASTYATVIQYDHLEAGTISLQKEMTRIPIVMKFIGSIKGKWYDFIENTIGMILRNIAVPFYISRLDSKKNGGKIAVLKPFRLNAKQIERLNSVIEKIIAEFLKNLADDFEKLSNTNLDTGAFPARGVSRNSDNLMKKLEDSDMKMKFKEIFGQDYKKYFENWTEFNSEFHTK